MGLLRLWAAAMCVQEHVGVLERMRQLAQLCDGRKRRPMARLRLLRLAPFIKLHSHRPLSHLPIFTPKNLAAELAQTVWHKLANVEEVEDVPHTLSRQQYLDAIVPGAGVLQLGHTVVPLR